VVRLADRVVARTQPVGPEESLIGYLLRVAATNGYADPAWLLREACEATGAQQPSRLAALAQLTGAEPVALAAIASPACTLPDAVVDAVHPKLCIACLRASPWLRRVWDIRVVLACPEHRTMLLDACPGCGARLTWRRPGLARCACRHDLLAASEVAAPSALVALAAAIADLCDGPRPADQGIAPVADAATAARLVWFVASDVAAIRAAWRSFHMAKPRCVDVAPAVAAAAPVLLDWPGGLHIWLHSRAQPASTGAGVKATFGRVLHRLLASLRGPEFVFIHAEIRRWLAEDWRGGRVKPWSPLYTRPRAGGLLTGAEAAERLGIAPSRVPRLVAAGLLDARASLAGSRVFHLVPDAAVADLLARSAGALTMDAAAGRLGVSPGQVERLTRTGLVRSLRNPPLRPQGVYVEPDTIAELEASLEEACAPRLQCGVGGGTLAALSDRGRASLVATVRGILEGSLAVVRGDTDPGTPVLRRYLAPAGSIAAPSESGSAGQACVPVRTAAASLSVSVRMVPRLVEAGCLEATTSRGARGRLGRRTVTAASVAAFPGRFTTATGLAATWRTSTREVSRRLAASGVEPVLPRDLARGISAVWRRSDCEDA
jgi:hypothetical protein